MSSTVSDADSRAADYETVERRYNIAVNLESWELLAMHSIASDESIPRVRLRMLKSLAGLVGTDTPPASPSSSTSRRAPQ
ncbi:uncharacterized protein H6S33_000062 [Morchella sextelata]|uniref:uncharacterized protein n=1 Tax=Morchella sextelata TaxID=1174677 RepID=UPI001D0492C5|nr:uncharacterized protein H6S33_000062 [Morchella sextelata]KAH0614426.1 hypothetical protein H6S33_000062 [Morchella sextelata]